MTAILTRAQLDEKHERERQERIVADSRAKRRRWAARRRKIVARKRRNHRKTRIRLAKQGRRNSRG